MKGGSAECDNNLRLLTTISANHFQIGPVTTNEAWRES